MLGWRQTAAIALLCSMLCACGGGGGGDGSGGGGGGGGPPPIPAPHAFLPTDTSIQLTYSAFVAPSSFEATTSRNSQFIAPFVYPTRGKEYYVSNADGASFAGFYSPQVFVSGAGTFTADARFNTPITLFTNSDTQQTTQVNGSGTVTITPTYGDQPLTYSGSVSYLGTEPVTNGFGTFQSKHVRLSITVSVTVQGTTFQLPFFVDYWFARNLGIVQRLEAGQLFRLTNAVGPDGDGDGVFNGIDLFPNNAAEARDGDGDGIGDNADTDDDNDGVLDANDKFPHDANETTDFDNDGTGDKADLDDDNDGLPDVADPFPFDIHNTDTDHDGIADFYDSDDDGDGVADVVDPFPLNPFESADADHDGQGDNGDPDDDNDGHPDVWDTYPFDPTRWEALDVGQHSLSLTAVFGSSVMPSTTLSVIGDSIGWQATSSASWLQLSALSGTGAATLTVSTNTQALAAGTHTAKLTFTDPGISRTVEVDVQITVSLPVLTASVNSISYDGRFGWSDLTRPLDVSLNTGFNSYPVSVQVSFGAANTVTTTFTDGVADANPHRLNVTLDPTKLKSGQHTGQVTLTAHVNGQDIARTLPLEALASERVLYASNDGVALAHIGSVDSTTRTVTILDSYGVAGTQWTATDNQPWLTVTPSGLSGGSMTITANPTGLAADVYYATVTLASADANVESTKAIRVALWVQPLEEPDLGFSVPKVYKQLAADPLRPFVYAHNGSGTIDVFNNDSRMPRPAITGLSGTLGPMVASSDGKWLFVLDPTNGSVTRIDLDDTSVRTTWPLPDFKPSMQPTALVYARPSGHGILVLNDRRVIDAESSTVFALGGNGQLVVQQFDLGRTRPQGDGICVVSTQFTPFGGQCLDLRYSTYGTPDVSGTQRIAFDGHVMPSSTAGFATDFALTPDGESIIIAQSGGGPVPVIRFSMSTGLYLGPVLPENAAHPRRAARSVAVGSDGAIYADVLNDQFSDDGVEAIYSWNADGTERNPPLQLSASNLTGLLHQLVVPGDAMGAAYLTSTFVLPQIQPTESTELNFIRGY
jgi:hypothetical protein